MKVLPKTTLLRRNDTHRLIPSKYSVPDESVLTRLSRDTQTLADLFALDDATNERLLAEHDLLLGIGIHELVFGVPNFRIVNAAFTHAHPLGSRFNGPTRGAWYASFDVETSKAEVIAHRTIDLAEVGVFEDSVTYDDYLADFSAELHDIRNDERFIGCLSPTSYKASQALAERLLQNGSLGIIFPSARRKRGVNLACFRPSLVMNVRKAKTYRFTWSGAPTPTVATERQLATKTKG